MLRILQRSMSQGSIPVMHIRWGAVYGLGFGFGAAFFYLPEQFQSEIGATDKEQCSAKMTV